MTLTEFVVPSGMAPVLSGLAAFAAVIAVVWPYLERDRLGERLARVAGESDRLRREMRGERREGPRGLAGLYEAAAKRIEALRRLPTAGTARKLQMAGMRGPNAVMAFVALRVVAGAGLFVATFLYLDIVMRLDQPRLVLAGMALGGGLAGVLLPPILLQNRIVKRQTAIRRAWPNALDLLLICVESGMGIDQAMRKVSEEIGLESVDLAEELTLTVAELSYLPDRRQAFENLAARTGVDAVRAVVASLKQAERHGTSLGTSLRVLSQENRDLRLAAAEKKAAALPPKLTVPMILFFLPVLFAVIITPAAIQIMTM